VITNSPPEIVHLDEPCHSVPVLRFAFHHALNRADFAAFRREQEKCEAAIEDFQPDLIHLNSSTKSLFSFALAQRSQRRPAVLTFHDRHLYRRTSVLAAEVFDNVDAFTAISEFIRDDILAHQPQLGARLHTIGNALPPPGVEPTPLPAPARLLAFGRIVEDKGFDLAIDAFGRVAADFPEVTFTLAGEGEKLADLKLQAAKHRLQNRVRFTGWIAPDDIPALINRHSLVIMPSRWQEPFGLVALQAAQMGRPICAARIGGIPEIVRDGETGRLFESENVSALEECLRALLASPELAGKMGRAALDHANDNFSFDRFVAAYEQVYAGAAKARLA
jgi:glycogen(starch) synthase